MAIQDDLAGFFSKAIGFVFALIRVVLLLFVGLLLSASLLLAIASNGVRLSLLDSSFYIAQLDKTDAYGLAKTAAINAGVDSIARDLPFDDDQRQSFSAEMKIAFNDAVPTSWVKDQSDRLIRNSFAYAKSEAAELDLNVSTTRLKPSLKAGARKFAPKAVEVVVRREIAKNNSTVIAAANDYFARGGVGPGGCLSVDSCLTYCLAHQDECASSLNLSQGQVERVMGTDSQAATTGVAESSSATSGIYESIDRQIDVSVPDTIDLDGLANHAPSNALAQVREPLATALTACSLLVVLCLVLAGIQAVIAWGTKNALRHVGVPFIITGAIACTASFLAPNIALDMVSKNLQSSGQAAQFVQVAMTVATPAIRGLFETTLVLSITVGVLGLAMIALSFIVERNEQEALKESGQSVPSKKQ